MTTEDSGTPTGAPFAKPVAPRPTVTTCPCGAAYTGLEGEKWFAEHRAAEHPPSSAEVSATHDKEIAEIRAIVEKALKDNDVNPIAYGDAIHALAAKFGIGLTA